MASYRILTSSSSWRVIRRHLYLQVSQFSSTIKYRDIEITLNENPKPKPFTESIVFGKHFTNHMLLCYWEEGDGWSSPKILPYGNLPISPAATALQSGVECFEGLKVYSGVDDRIRLFRPLDYLKRLNTAAGIQSLPNFHEGDFLECIKELIRIDRGWIPKVKNSFLYVRSLFIGVEPSLNDSKASNKALLYCIACPVEPDMRPISVYADSQFNPPLGGGPCGTHNIGGNYAPFFRIQRSAQSKGCDAILWLERETNEIITVDSGKNIFIYWINESGGVNKLNNHIAMWPCKNPLYIITDSEIITPPLKNESVFPGITRSSLIDLANCWNGYTVKERTINMMDIKNAVTNKRIKEMFVTDTIGVLNPISNILYMEENIHIPTMSNTSHVVERFLKELSDIQCGFIDHQWSVIVE